jgi:rod shape-determining protein MreB
MAFKSLLGLFSSDLAIDFGTWNTLIYAKGRGILVSEHSVVALNERSEIVALGKDVYESLGRASERLNVIRPLKDGVIARLDLAEKLIHYFIIKAHNNREWAHPRVVVGVHNEITPVERHALESCAYHAGASEVYLVEEAIAASHGVGVSMSELYGTMIVDVGGGTTDIYIMSMGCCAYSRSLRCSGTTMDDAIVEYVKEKYNLLIGKRMAEEIKITIGSAFPLDEGLSIVARGRDQLEGVLKTVEITDEEVREALADNVATIVNAVRVALERVPPELAADIMDRGLILTGGGALLKNLDRRLSIETGLPVLLAEDPEYSVVLGLGKTLQDFGLLKRLKGRSSIL